MNLLTSPGHSRFCVGTQIALAFIVFLANSADGATASTLNSDGLRIVAISDDPALSIPGGSVSGVSIPVLNNHGQIAFTASVLQDQGSEPLVNSSLWLANHDEEPALLALEGQFVPNRTDDLRFFDRFSNIVLNDEGQVAFVSNELSNRGILGSQIWIYGEEQFRLIADSDSAIPSAVDAAHIVGLPRFRFNNTGQLLLIANVRSAEDAGTGDSSRGLWLFEDNSIQLLAEVGVTAPGTNGQASYFDFGDVALGNDGALAVEIWLNLPVGEHPSGGRQKGVLSTLDLSPIAYTFDDAPGTGTMYAGFADVTVAKNGRVAFGSGFFERVEGPTAINNGGVWIEDDSGQLQLVARSGERAPDTPEGVFFESFGDIVVSAQGDAAFYGYLWSGSGDVLAGTNSTGIWRTTKDGEIELIIRDGDPAPLLTNGITISSISEGAFALNSLGQIAFTDNFGIEQTAVWATDKDSNLQLILASGMTLEVAPGDFRTTKYVWADLGEGSGAGTSSGFNDLGQLALSVVFDDGSSGIVVSNAVSIPEGCSTSLMCWGVILVLGGRWIPTKR